MQCPKHGATISPQICIKRQEISKRGFVTKKIETKTECRIFQNPLPDSFKACGNCATGKLVRLFPGMYVSRDFLLLITEHMKILKERGYIFKQDIDLISLVVAEKNEKLTEDERIDLIDHIAEISKKLVIERRLNGKTSRVLSATGCRIARYLRKQRCSERDQQTDSSSIGA